MSRVDKVEDMCSKMDARSISLMVARQHDAAESPISFLSPESREQLGNRLSTIQIGYCALAKTVLAERLKLQGFSRENEPLGRVWRAWTDAGMDRGLALALDESLTVGQSFLLVWAGPDGSPTVSVESPSEVSVTRDPLSGQITAAVKRWVSDGRAHVILMEPETITTFSNPVDVPAGGVLPSTGWSQAGSIHNPLGQVPLVDLTLGAGLFDTDGTPVARPIWSLVAALHKTTFDQLVSSESVSMPRRYATGIQLQQDPDTGEMLPPFSTEPGSMLLAESADAKFGTLSEGSLDSYASLTNYLIRQIGATAAISDARLGIEVTDPSSAEQLRASEQATVSRVYAIMTLFGPALARAASLVEAVLSGGPVKSGISPEWASPESVSYAQTADATAKLYGAGLIPWETAMEKLGYRPDEIHHMRRARMRQAIEMPEVPNV